MALWDNEFEALRPQLRKEAATFVASVPWQEGGSTTLSLEERVAAHRRVSLGGPPSDKAVDRTIEGPAGTIRLRTFNRQQPNGVLLHIHGGAWMAGSAEMMDLLNEVIVDKCNVSVVSVDYRLAPEHPYPSGPDDCEAAACWLLERSAEEFGSDRLLIAGESAGAHLAAVTLLRMRDKHARRRSLSRRQPSVRSVRSSLGPRVERGVGVVTRNRHFGQHRVSARPLPARYVRRAATPPGRLTPLR